MYPRDYNSEEHRIIWKDRDTGRLVSGTTMWDGLSDIFSVKTDDGETRFCTVLDKPMIQKVS